MTYKNMANIKLFIVSIVTAALILGLTFLLLKWNPVLYQDIKQLIPTFSSALSVKPEPFTELYFENNENLPQKITNNTQFIHLHPTLALFTFQFTIHNLEGKNMRYPYEVFSVINGKKT